jgi:hypothetical protein
VGGNVFYSATYVADDPVGAMSRVYEDHYEQSPSASRALPRARRSP